MSNNPNKPFLINQVQEPDVIPVKQFNAEIWLDTYINDDYGVTREWIEERNGRLLSEESINKSIETLHNPRVARWVAKDLEERVVGHATHFISRDDEQILTAFNVRRDYWGTGLSRDLMGRVLGWFDLSKPITLGVATYNERAKAFYRKHGFVETDDPIKLFDGRIPEVKMVRKGDR